MGQITYGLRAILSSPTIYSAFQVIMGAHHGRVTFVADFVRPQPNINILDIGCGPAEILDYLPKVNYWGFDVSAPYIARATSRYGSRGHFFRKELNAEDLVDLPSFDIVMAIGLLHHLDDEAAVVLLNLAHDALKPGGRLVTIDPCLASGQNPIAEYLVLHDRGRNVRAREGYELLVSGVFLERRVEVRHRTWIPYTHCIMECTK